MINLDCLVLYVELSFHLRTSYHEFLYGAETRDASISVKENIAI
jgi:hypothetical protein